MVMPRPSCKLFGALSMRRRKRGSQREPAPAKTEGVGAIDIEPTPLPGFRARFCLNAGTYGTMVSGSAGHRRRRRTSRRASFNPNQVLVVGIVP